MEHGHLNPGSYVDGWWGHYQSIRVIELGMSLGYEDSTLDDDQLNVLIAAYSDNADEVTLIEKDGDKLHLNHTDGFTIADIVYETYDDVIDYINEHHTPEGHWFGHHPDLGDVGVWSDHADCTPTWCEAACEPNSRCPEFHKEQETE